MRYDWDENKARQNLRKHGVGFNEAARALRDLDRLEEVDDRFDYGEERVNSICRVDVDMFFVVSVLRQDDLTRIISARRATKYEESLYYNRS